MSDFYPGPWRAQPEQQAGSLVPSPPASRDETIAALTQSLQAGLSQTVRNLVEAGQLLLEAKQILGHGRFRKWLAEHFNISAKTANRFMGVAQMVRRHGLDQQAIGRLLRLDLKTLYELAAKSTPDAVQQRLLQELAEQREISYELVRRYKREAGKTPQPAGIAAELQDFGQRLQSLGNWLDAHQAEVSLPLTQDPQTLSELLGYARILKRAQSQIDGLLTQALAPELPPQQVPEPPLQGEAMPADRSQGLLAQAWLSECRQREEANS